MRPVYARSRKPIQQNLCSEVHLPAPKLGLNAVSAIGDMPPEYAVQLFNMLPSEYGLRARLGSREWASGLTGTGDDYVRTIIPFKGSAASGASDKLFAATSRGIFDVTDSGGVTSVWDDLRVEAYETGDFVTASSTTYVCVVGGLNGSALLPSVWVAATVYSVNDRAIHGSNVYICTTGGTSHASDGPTGETAGITDGTVVWDFVSLSSEVVDGAVTWRHMPNSVEPLQMLSFSINSGRAGHGIWAAVVTTAGLHYVLYCDEENGLHIYSQTSGLWDDVAMGANPATEISGVDPVNFVSVLSFKGRVWFVEKDTSNLWYLSAGAVFGAATKFAVGAQLKSGGPIRNIWSWTYDGGSGLDDSLVIVADGGDVLVYQGTDPSSSTTWGLRGIWYAGDLPAGREIAISLSGDVLLLTRLGLLPLSKLVVGAQQYATETIGPLFNAAMLSKATTQGWTLRLHPEENALLVTVPEAEGSPTNQLVMSLSKGNGWARYRDLDIYASAVFGGKLYFGTVDGSVYINDGYVDGRTLAEPTAATPVQYAGLSSFQNLGNARNKQIQLIKPYFLGESSQPSFAAEARYDFNFTEMSPVSQTPGTGNVWDSAVWDTAVWGGDYAPSSEFRGAAGLGVHAAIAWRGAAVSRTVLAGFDVHFQPGGAM